MQPPQKLASTACARPPPFRMQTDPPWQLCEYCTGAAVSSTNGAVLGTTDGTAVTHLAAAHVSTAVGLGPWQRNSVESRSSESDKQYLWHQVLKSSYETGLQLRHVAFERTRFGSWFQIRNSQSTWTKRCICRGLSRWPRGQTTTSCIMPASCDVRKLVRQ
jgi:hypothetical protein